MLQGVLRRCAVLALSVMMVASLSITAFADEKAQPIAIDRFDALEQVSYEITVGDPLPDFPTVIRGVGADDTEYLVEVTWTSQDYSEAPGIYTFVCVMPEGYEVTDGVVLPAVTLVVTGPVEDISINAGRASRAPKTMSPMMATAGSGLVDTTVSDELLVKALVGENVDPINIRITGDVLQRGLYSGADGVLEIGTGIVLSTGDANTSFGDTPDNTDFFTPGDPDLEALVAGEDTFDAVVVEFDFIPQTPTVTFQYVFSSSEWTEDSEYNDVLGLFVNGRNCAVLPNGSPVEIQNVLSASGLAHSTVILPPTQGYFINTEAQTGFAFTGRTVALRCETAVTVGEPTHVKLALTDTNDTAVDSALFIQGGSIGAVPLTTGAPRPLSTKLAATDDGLSVGVPAQIVGIALSSGVVTLAIAYRRCRGHVR